MIVLSFDSVFNVLRDCIILKQKQFSTSDDFNCALQIVNECEKDFKREVDDLVSKQNASVSN